MSTFEHVVWPVIRINVDAPVELAVDSELSGRLWFFQVLPAWTHHLRIVRDGPAGDGAFELYTNERSGPLRVWNHRLRFEPTGDNACRYTDEVELEGGALGAAGAAFVRVFFRYRQWRWRRMARRLG